MRQQPRWGVAHVENNVVGVDLGSRIPRTRGGPVVDGDGPSITSSGWQRRYARLVAVCDLVTVLVVGAAGALIGVLSDGIADRFGQVSILVGVISLLGVAVALVAFSCWDPRILGHGSEEFNRLLRAFSTSAVLLALAGLAFEVETVRLWVFCVLPAAGLLTMLGRYALRRQLHRRRRRGGCLLSVVAVGTPASVADLIARTRRAPEHGWVVTGVCTPTGNGLHDARTIEGVPVLSDLDGLPALVSGGRFSIVAVSPAPGWSSKRLQALAWDLEGTGTELVVDPGLMEVAGPRLHVTPVDGLPLLRLTEPRFAGSSRLIKAVSDKILALVFLLLFLPLFVVIAVAVRRDGDPVFYRQTRVGLNGATFTMIKFRSMRVAADDDLEALRHYNDGSGPLFKLRQDPRVTRIGAYLRRYSLDELPQLLNVLGGSMSLIGPRPPLPGEVEAYGPDAQRKLLVRPGMTGLWQVSGRSDLSWEETVRLDLRYVENWSPALDLTILWKTIGAVVRGRGAY